MKYIIALSALVFAIGCNVSDPDAGMTPEPEPTGVCEADSCNGNGECSVVDGVVSCACDEGYSGAACDGCAAGFQDNDANGTCEASCASASIDCGTGNCSDVSGTAACECDEGYDGDACGACAEGYQDEDSNGTCLPTCATSGLECGPGTCGIEAGEAACTCPDAYAGESCGTCAAGYQDNDGDGVCTEGCDLVDLACPNQQQCDDSTGEPLCACGPGDPCVDCPEGEQDEDGNGVCTQGCVVADSLDSWWNPEFRNRLTFSFTATTGFAAGDAVAIPFNHLAEVEAGRSLENGDDVRVVYVAEDGTATELERAAEGDSWNVADVNIVFALPVDMASGTKLENLWLYWNNQTAANPPLLTIPSRSTAAVSVDDPTQNLLCDSRAGSFYSIQLRQLQPDSVDYQIVVRDMTGDDDAYARIFVSDTAGNEIVRREYGNLGGACCNPGTARVVTEDVQIAASDFVVTLASGEFSGSDRYFGCTRFATRNPGYDGTQTFTYRVQPLPFATSDVCER